jgi:hypothetical protein
MPDSNTLLAAGLLPFRGSLMLDLVFLAMFAVVPALGFSIYLVKQGKYQLHKRLQLLLGSVLFIAVVAFEVDMRINGWQHLAVPSPHWTEKGINSIWIALFIHLSFAIPTFVLWIVVIFLALRKFPSPPVPNAHSPLHKKLGWLAAGGMTMTAVTGWVFYYLAFVA